MQTIRELLNGKSIQNFKSSSKFVENREFYS